MPTSGFRVRCAEPPNPLSQTTQGANHATTHLRPRPPAGLDRAAAVGACPGLPEQAHPLHRAGVRGRRQRHGRPHRDRALGQGPEPDLRGGQPGRRRRRDRIAEHRARAGRWLHPDAGLRRHPRHQPGHAQAALRRGQGLHAHRHDRRHAQRAGGQRRRAGQGFQAVRCLREGQSEQDQLRLGRRGIAHPPDHGALQAAGRRVHAARALPRHRAGLHRPGGRPDASHVPGPGRGDAAHPVAARAPAGRHWYNAPPGAAGRADARGARPQGLRCHAVVRRGRPGRHACRHRSPAQRIAQRGTEGAGPAGSSRSRPSNPCP